MDMEERSYHLGGGRPRGAEALREFWRRFKLSGARLKAVAMDMSGAYACSVRAHAPHAILTFRPFHVMKLMKRTSAMICGVNWPGKRRTERPRKPLRGLADPGARVKSKNDESRRFSRACWPSRSKTFSGFRPRSRLSGSVVRSG